MTLLWQPAAATLRTPPCCCVETRHALSHTSSAHLLPRMLLLLDGCCIVSNTLGAVRVQFDQLVPSPPVHVRHPSSR